LGAASARCRLGVSERLPNPTMVSKLAGKPSRWNVPAATSVHAVPQSANPRSSIKMSAVEERDAFVYLRLRRLGTRNSDPGLAMDILRARGYLRKGRRFHLPPHSRLDS
jgi:hypothetical protein